MIVGNGLIANLFKNEDRENVVFFASGVSNSLETEKSAFLREENLLRNTSQKILKKYSSTFLLVVFMIPLKMEVST